MDGGINNLKKQNGKLEIYVASVLTIHFASMLSLAIVYHWESWIVGYNVTAIVVMWLLVLGKFRGLHARVYTVYVIYAAALLIFYINSGKYGLLLTILAAASVMFALFSIAQVLVMSIGMVAVLAVLHFGVLQNITTADTDNFVNDIFYTMNVAFLCAIIFFWVNMRNISQRNMGKYIAELKMAQKGKDDFIANVSHEIRTPVNTIAGLSDILMQEENPTKLKGDLDRIRTAGRSLMFVVSDILDFSELEKGEIQLEEEVYDISSTINDVINISNAQKQGKPVELIVNYDANLPRGLVGDEKKIRRALVNIVGNAFKFTESGCVVISVTHRVEEYGINLILSVKDTGIGMSREELDKLFSTYNQADASRSRGEGGIGLGLAITQAIVKAMGGTISVFSERGKGTEVRIVVSQKVSDSRPIIEIDNANQINAGIYFNMEQFLVTETRDAYAYAIENMQKQLKLKSSFCRSLAELKRRQASNSYTHLFIGFKEYLEDSAYFDALADKLKVIMIIDQGIQSEVDSRKIYQIYKPIQLMPIAQAFINTSNDEHPSDPTTIKTRKFTTNGVRILAVDDSEMNLRVISGLVKRYNIETIQVLSGVEALEAVTSQNYDFIFMDHMMPEMDGVECLHRIRELPGEYYRTVPIIALTANAVAGAREMLLSEGFDDFIEKPVEISVLERLLLRVISSEKIIYVDDEAPEVKPEVSEQTVEKPVLDGNYTLDSLNQENGYLYCGGAEAYEEILQVYAVKGKDNYLPLSEVFVKKDWENYVILIHAVKSSMKAIGADILSEEARLLEMAGKENDIDYILEHHEHVYEMYRSLIVDIMEHYQIPVNEADEVTDAISDLPELDEAALNDCKKLMENAMYELDADAMLDAMKSVWGHCYKGKDLDKELKQIEQKIKMSDLMSAADAFLKL